MCRRPDSCRRPEPQSVLRQPSGLLLQPGPRCSSQNIRKSLPLTRLSGAGRTGVGHRRWAQQRTPALRPQTEQRPPGLSAPRSLCLSLPRLSSATRFACTLPPRRRRSLRRNQGDPGGLSRLCRGIISPGGVRGSAPLLRLVHLPILLRCSGLSVFLFCLS